MKTLNFTIKSKFSIHLFTKTAQFLIYKISIKIQKNLINFFKKQHPLIEAFNQSQLNK